MSKRTNRAPKCRTCKGHGYIDGSWKTKEGFIDSGEVDCPECGEVGRAVHTLREAGVDTAAKFDALLEYIEDNKILASGENRP